MQVFLTKRQYSPFKDTFAVVGTFIDLNYELGETMKKCVKNKVNLSNFYSEQLFTFGEKSRDPRTRVISCSYLILTNQEEQPQNLLNLPPTISPGKVIVQVNYSHITHFGKLLI